MPKLAGIEVRGEKAAWVGVMGGAALVVPLKPL